MHLRAQGAGFDLGSSIFIRIATQLLQTWKPTHVQMRPSQSVLLKCSTPRSSRSTRTGCRVGMPTIQDPALPP